MTTKTYAAKPITAAVHAQYLAIFALKEHELSQLVESQSKG